MSRRQRNRPEIQKLRREVKVLREELNSALSRIDKQAEEKFKSIEFRAGKILEGFVKKISEIIYALEKDIQSHKLNIFQKIWKVITGRKR